ncbi:MAG: hypothetical protein HY343_02015, partial [Lentisphaerae bacterium]|nr:hypothetical protein [Lentisphaerota bacterium]
MRDHSEFWGILVFLTVLCPAHGFDFGPIASRDTSPDGRVRWRAAGPFFEYQKAPDHSTFWALRPLFSSTVLPSDRRKDRECLWPIWFSKTQKDDYVWRLIYLVNWHNFEITNAAPRYSFWILPLYFQGRDAGERKYWALFPIGGTIRDFLMRDEMTFVLFPLYGRARINEVTTRTWFWPVFSRTTGHGNERHRVFPFYLYSSRRGEIVKRSILWPLWTSARYSAPESPGYGYFLFPLYGHVKLQNHESWYVVPPFIRFTRGEKQSVTYCPWPFVQTGSGIADKFYLWPLWGRKTIEGERSAFVLWPFYRQRRVSNSLTDRDHVVLFPFLRSERQTWKAPEGGKQPPPPDERAFKLWPLYTYRAKGDAASVHAPTLWPFKDFAPI